MLRVLFAGTPKFAVPTLEALIDDPEISVECVLSQPDRPSGRGQKLSESAVKRCAITHGLAVRQPDTLKDPEEVDWIRGQHFDALVVASAASMFMRPFFHVGAGQRLCRGRSKRVTQKPG